MLKIEEIREIIKLIDESSINEFSYETENTKVKLKKATSNPEVSQVNQTGVMTTDQPVNLSEQLPISHQNESEPETETVKNEDTSYYDYEICSPMVGTLFNASAPESDPYVKTGSKVSKDTIVCIVEAMKLFNEIEAEVSGEIVEVLVENGELVEYGQPLFRVKKK